MPPARCVTSPVPPPTSRSPTCCRASTNVQSAGPRCSPPPTPPPSCPRPLSASPCIRSAVTLSTAKDYLYRARAMHRGPRITLQTQLVLRAMLAEPAAERYGLQLCAETGLPSGTIYPIVARLEQLGWVHSSW